jgi:hypothetical protein
LSSILVTAFAAFVRHDVIPEDGPRGAGQTRIRGGAVLMQEVLH